MATDDARFFQDEDQNFVFLIVLGGAYERVADVGTCLAIADGIKDGDARSAFDAFANAGARMAAIAEQAAAGHRVSAREAYMQAANYVSAATYFIDRAGAPERFAPTWREHQALWNKGAALLEPPMQEVRIPYEDTTLPGYFYRVDDTGRRRPLLILNNGSDGGAVAAWTTGIAAALRRGYHALTFYGPGQGLALLEQNVPFRHDWEKVIGPVIDYVLGRPEVDPERIALLGISQAGYWVPRAVAFEPRIRVAIADPGVFDVSTSWTRYLPPEMMALLDGGRQEEFDRYFFEGVDEATKGIFAFRARPYGLSSPYEIYQAVRQYTLAGVVDRIRCPMLICDPDNEAFWPGQSQQVHDALRCPKTLVTFTAAEGADLHCEPKTPGLRAQRIFDWLDEALRSPAAR